MEEQCNDCMCSWISAAAFFITYENVKSVLPHGSSSYLSPATHMVAASLGEVVRRKFIYCVSMGGEETIQLWKLGFGVISCDSSYNSLVSHCWHSALGLGVELWTPRAVPASAGHLFSPVFVTHSVSWHCIDKLGCKLSLQVWGKEMGCMETSFSGTFAT